MGPSGRNIPHEGARVPLRSDPTDDHNSGSAHTNMQHTAGHGHEEQHQVRATQPGQTPEDLQDFATWWTVAIRHTNCNQVIAYDPYSPPVTDVETATEVAKARSTL